MEIKNRTPLVAAWTLVLGKDAAESLCVAVRGTWSIDERGRLALLAEQPPYQPLDECVGKQGLSSVRYEADTGEMKPGTDCALIGSAVAPKKGKATKVDVSFKVGSLSRRVTVTGERRRMFWLLRWWSSGPKPFQRVPLQWELAAGGSDVTPKKAAQHSQDLRNPYGRGFRAKGSRRKRAGELLPQILGPMPAGLGLTGPQFAHRKQYSGTYDKAWLENRCPLLPEDFDERFHLAAAPGMSSPKHLVGGEAVEITGCTAAGKLAFKLPRVTPDVSAVFPGGPEPLDMRLVTVTVDTDAMQLRLLWRGQLRVHGRFPKLQHIGVEAAGLA